MQQILLVLRDIQQVLSSPDWGGISGIVGIASLAIALIALFRSPQPSSRQVARFPYKKISPGWLRLRRFEKNLLAQVALTHLRGET